MTATQTNTDDGEKSTVPDHVARHADSLRVEADRLGEQLHDLADALEAGTADAALVDDTIRMLAATYVPLEDAAGSAGVIDDSTARYRAMNMARRVLYRQAVGDHTRAAEDAREASQHIRAVREAQADE